MKLLKYTFATLLITITTLSYANPDQPNNQLYTVICHSGGTIIASGIATVDSIPEMYDLCHRAGGQLYTRAITPPTNDITPP